MGNAKCAVCGFTERKIVHQDWAKRSDYHPFEAIKPKVKAAPAVPAEAPGFDPEIVKRFEKQQAWASRLVSEQGMAPLTAIIVAGDLVGADEWTARVNAGDYPAEKAAWLVGSYARLDWAIEHCDRDWVVSNLAELWRSSDPDDTKLSVYLPLWKDAAFRSEDGYVRDGKPLPRGRFTELYRGQMPNDPHGMAWTTDVDVAHRFAKGAGVRVRTAGIVVRGFAWRQDALAYLTGRGEAEVVIDPRKVMATEVIGKYEFVKEKE